MMSNALSLTFTIPNSINPGSLNENSSGVHPSRINKTREYVNKSKRENKKVGQKTSHTKHEASTQSAPEQDVAPRIKSQRLCTVQIDNGI
jgi:hypothetical protein